MQTFEAEITKEENGRLTFIEIPFDAREVFSILKGTIYVKGRINEVEYRSKLLSRGNDVYILVLNKALQKQVGFQNGPMPVNVTMSVEKEEINGPLKEMKTASSGIDVITAIRERRSIRKFQPRPVDETILYTILSAGLQAPTAKNKRPYHFIVIREKETLEILASQNHYAVMLKDAACGIVVCGDRNIEGYKEFLYEDCAAATQNILLGAHGLGLGAVWCGVVQNSDWKKLIIDTLNLPLKIEPVSVIALGYPDECRQAEERWDSGKVHFDRW